MTANVLVPLVIAVYIFVLDWRMGLASLVTLVIGMVVAGQSGKTYAVRWEGAVKTGKRMADAIVEYVGGIQVVKAFSQSAGSYRRYADAVNDNAQYYVDWMHDNQKYMASMQSIVPAVLVTILPVGTGLWGTGSLSAAEFFTIIILSLGLTGPLMAAMTFFVDDLAVVGTNVGEIAAILEADELERPKEIAELKGNGIELHQVEFSYGEKDGRSAAWHQSFHSAGNSQCIGRTIRFRKINTCKTDCRFLECNRRKYHIGRNGYPQDTV